MHKDSEFGAEPEFEHPIDVILWASRIYLAHTMRREPVPAIVEETFSDAGLSYLYEALKRVHNRLIVAATSGLYLHDPVCPQRSFHEQAFISALRKLGDGCTAGYTIAMSAILPPSAIRLAHTDMTIIASALADIERFWPADVSAGGAYMGWRTPASGSGALH